ncbi:hypothetical protein [Leptotrichia massiliensis]|uniref:hypothetical protein n=1 Tax=Leptotrichia massiliensis TaxID=1852388 RepID=UPI0008D97E49|nr:hypothetical protein [Leptotrichia massiliensis]
MLITVEDYKRITGKTLADEELAKVETLLSVAISQIENITGYKLEVETLTEDYDYNKRIYLNKRPVVEIVGIDFNDRYKSRGNYIEFVNFRNCPCNAKEKEIEITYKAGYDELPDWLKYEICILVNDFINSMDEEASKYKTYKIDDISYSFVDFVNNKKEKIESIVRRIYG